MGLGKTLTAILLSKLKGLPTIVICPNTLTDTWRKELTENGVAPTDIWVYRRPEEAKKEEQYRGRFIAWLTS
jgi:SNF2 family DNA or RNA helicase